MRYDDRLKCYIIASDDISKYSIDYLNNFPHRLLIEYPNTSSLSTSFIDSITNLKVGYRIVGGYDQSKIDYWTERNKGNPRIRKGRYNITGLTYYEDSNIYNKSTMRDILKRIEDIEQGIMPEWSDMKKALYIYDRLREEVIYHPDYEKQESFDIRTLRGLVSKKTVCAGYAIMFKEFMDRLGIECQYVEGASSKEKYDKGQANHAWNIIKIHGQYFPIDLTWDAGQYRQGKSDSFGWFSQIDRFKMKHYPHSIEPVQDYDKLRGIKRSYVKSTIDSFKKKKDYSESVIKLKNTDGDIVYITQLEKVRNVADTFDPVYRYVVAKKDQNGNFTDYRMVFSESNLLSSVYKLQWKKTEMNSPEVRGLTQLFSYSNIDRARNAGSSYIGRVEVNSNDPRGYRLINKKRKRNKYPDKSGQFIKKTGENFVVFENPGNKIIEGGVIYSGYVGSFTEDGYREYKVCSEKSLFDENVRGKEASFYSDNFLDRRVRYAGGYLGCVSDEGRLSVDSDLEKYFDVKNAGDIKRSDVVWKDNVYNTGYATTLEFEDVRDVYLKYEAEYSDDFTSYKMVDRETGEELKDEKMTKIAKFASMWRGAAGTKVLADEEYPGMYYAFNDGSALVYDYLVSSCRKQLETTGEIDFSQISEENMLAQGYRKYKYTTEIIDHVLKTPGRREILFDFCNLQVESYSNSAAALEAKTFKDANSTSELMAMFLPLNGVNSPVYVSEGAKK